MVVAVGRKTTADPSGMTNRKAEAEEKATAKATAVPGDSLHPTHRKVAMDGAPDLLWLLEGRQDRSRFPFRDDNKKAKATARTKATAFAHHRLEWSTLLSVRSLKLAT